VARDQTAADSLHAEERARQMDAQNLVPLRQRHLVDHGGPGDPGGVHEPIHDAEPRGALFDERFHEFWIHDVPRGCEDAIFRKLATSDFESLRARVRKDQVRAKVRREPRNAEADALTRACDENLCPASDMGLLPFIPNPSAGGY
jgi:hypothetical protein